MSDLKLPYSQDYKADRWDGNKNFQIDWENGQNVLYFRGAELREIGEHKAVFYENGVLLVFDVPSISPNKRLQSYYFYNNDGTRVFGVNNHKGTDDPEFWVEVEVYKRKVKVKKVSYATKVETEILYDVKSGQKIDNDNQISFNI